MAVLLKPLFLLPLLFICAYSSRKAFPLPDGGFEDENNNNQENGDKDGLGDQVIMMMGIGISDAEMGLESQKAAVPAQKPRGAGFFETNFIGDWKLHKENAGVAAMHIQLLPNNKAVWYDTTDLGESAIRFSPPSCTRRGPVLDCTAHAIEYDITTADIRTLKVEFDPWCSSGGLSPDGNLISTGGNNLGFRGMRVLGPCDGCKFEEKANALSAQRWYATQITLDDGNLIVIGGRGIHNYEIVPSNTLNFPIKQFPLPFLAETEDIKENNLYPFVNLLPDGNVFLFANNRSIILEPRSGKIVRELPTLPGGSRNYPASGMSAMLPIKLGPNNEKDPEVEIMICGGNKPEAFIYSENPPRTFFPAFKDCGRIKPMSKDAKWDIEEMPSPRVMGDLLILPNGELLTINGAQAGTSAWDAAKDPNQTPALYSPDKPKGQRFKELKPSTIPRMYHSVSAVLPDGEILVAGSNTHSRYTFKGVPYPTELRVEKFMPPYLAPELQQDRPGIDEDGSDKKLKYGAQFNVKITLKAQVNTNEDIMVTMYAPPFTTHGYSMNQRMLILALKNVSNQQITALAPPTSKVAPPGYYLLFVVYHGVPSHAMWVHIQ